jgi:toxin ParE1/3/4
LQRITRYIEKDNPPAALRVAHAIFMEAAALKDFPHRGRPGKTGDTREITFPGWPYILVYKVKNDAVLVVRVYHGAQDWP